MQISKMSEYGYFEEPFTWYNRFKFGPCPNFIKFLKIQNICMWGRPEKKIPQMILQAIIDPKRVIVCQDGSSFPTYTGKVQHLTQELKKLYNPSGEKNYSYLGDLYHSSLISGLVNVIIRPESSDDVRARGLDILHNLNSLPLPLPLPY